MPRVTNDREECPSPDGTTFHLWEAAANDSAVCRWCGTERFSRWIPTEADIANNRKEEPQ